MRTERDTAREREKYEPVKQHSYTDEELERIDEVYAQEIPRGAEPRYWEDVAVGDEIGPMVRGPFRATDAIAWEVGWGGRFASTGKFNYDYRRRHPGAYSKNHLGVPDIPERVHWETDFAREVGVPALYDYGPQRVSWGGNLMTNWIGDDGWLKRMWVQVRRFNIEGDVQWYRGSVIDKRVVAGECEVVCDLWAENQRGEDTAPAQAIALLPSREHGPVRVPLAGQPAYPEWADDTKVTPVGLRPLRPVSDTHGFRLPAEVAP